MRIILEGPDGAGKTTLADKIAKRFGMPVVHLTGIKDRNLLEKQFNTVHSMDDVILDRFVISNLSYSSVFGASKLDDSKVNTMLSSSIEDDIYIFCLPGYNGAGVDAYRAAYSVLVTERHEDFPDVGNMEHLWRYMSAMYDIIRVLGHAHVFDYMDDNWTSDKFIDHIAQYYGL